MDSQNNKKLEPKKFSIIDLETTGLNPYQHEILEIGLVLTQAPEFKIQRQKDWKIKPECLREADPEALRISGYTPELWKEAIPLESALKELSELTRNSIMVSQNISFDWNFLKQGFSETRVLEYFHYHRLDLLSMAYARLFHHPKILYYSLEALANFFKVPLDRKLRHSALEDAKAAYQIFVKLLEIPKPVCGS